MKKQNAYFIVWNSTKNNFNKILNDIKKVVIVKEKNILKISKYYNLICDLYSFNNQNDLGIFKANKMCNDTSYEIMILHVEFQCNTLGEYSVIKKMKTEVRNSYKQITKDYFHDNIIHGTDSIEEYNYVKKLISNLNKYI